MATERTVLVRLKANASDFVRGMGTAALAVRGLRNEIDTTNDRTAWLAQSILALGPALVPFGAAAVPVFSGLITQMTLTGVAAGTLALGFNGIGDALGALNDYQIDPTEAHLKKLEETMAKIGPEGEEFVRFLDTLGPQFSQLATLSRQGMFPGMEEGLTDLMTLMPKFSRIVEETAAGIGQLSAEAGAGLAGPRFEEFFEFLESDAKPILVEMGHTIGNFVDGLAAMIVAFAPLTRDFSTGFEGMSKSFADWAHGLSESVTFQEFIDYIRESGPKALDTLGAMVDALVSILKAAAPVGDVMLPVLESFFDIIAKIADTPLGPVFLAAAAAASVYGRAVALASITTGGMFSKMTPGLRTMNEQWRTTPIPTIRQFGTAISSVATSNASLAASATGVNRVLAKQATTTMQARNAVTQFARSMGPTAAAVGLLGTTMSGLDKKMGLTNTTSLALMGLLVGPWGAALGAGAGAVLDLRAANQNLEDSIKAVYLAADSGNLENLNAGIDALKKQLKDLQDEATLFEDPIQSTKDGLENLWILGPGDDPVKKTKAAIKELEAAQQDLLNQRASAASGGREFNGVTEATVRILEAEAAAAKKVAEALAESRKAARETAKQFFGLGDSVDDAEVSLNGWLKSLEDQAAALRDFTDNIRTVTKRGLRDGLIKELEAAGPAGALRMKQLADGTDAEIRRANRAWRLGKEAIREYVNVVGGVPQTVATELKVKAEAARKAIAEIRAQAEYVAKDWQIRFIVTQTNAINKPRVKPGNVDGTGADGATVPKSGLPYADRYLWAVADGEEIVSDRYGGATKNRPALKAASKGATLAVVPHAADGATVATQLATASVAASSVPAISVTGTSIDYGQMAAAFAGNRLLEHRDTRDSFLWAMRTALREQPVFRAGDPLDLVGMG